MPESDIRQEREASFASSFNFDSTTTCFQVGSNKVGVHVSSFAIQGRGSAAAAAGRDVFFLIDRRTGKVVDFLNLGVDKQRIRSEGRLNAMASHFIIADVNEDGFTDVGVVREEIRCSAVRGMSNSEETPSASASIYRQQPIVWYLTSNSGWKIDSSHTGELPPAYVELPLIGMIFSPVDVVAGLLWQTYDSTQWPHQGDISFVPQYRNNLVQHATKSDTSSPRPAWVEIAYCGGKREKPPLEKLLFHVTFHNPSNEAHWILLPKTIYGAPTEHHPDAGINAMELLAQEDDGIKLLKFLGTAAADPTDSNQGGGFQGILLAAKAAVTTDIAIDYWGKPPRLLAVTVIIAQEIILDGKPVTDYFHRPLQTNSSTGGGLQVDNWSTSDQREVPVVIRPFDRYTIANALARPCGKEWP